MGNRPCPGETLGHRRLRKSREKWCGIDGRAVAGLQLAEMGSDEELEEYLAPMAVDNDEKNACGDVISSHDRAMRQHMQRMREFFSAPAAFADDPMDSNNAAPS